MMHRWKLLLTVAALTALAGCAGPDMALDCPVQGGEVQGCYAGDRLLENRQMLEQAAKDTCTQRGEDNCFLMIWSRQEGTLPAPGQIRSDLPEASYEWNEAEGLDCFMTFSNGMIEYASEGCPWD